jgi:hypothetical protein
MVMTATFNDLVKSSTSFGFAPRSWLARIKNVSKNLTEKAIELGNTDITLEKAVSALTNSVKAAWNSSREDKAWVGLTVAAGIGAKLATFSLLNVASGGTVTAALIGGAAVGVTKSLITSYRESKKEEGQSFVRSFFSKKTLMTTASTTALSAATFGVLGAFESLTGVNIAEKIGQGLRLAFNTAAKFGKTAGQFAFNHIPMGSVHAATFSDYRPVQSTAIATNAPVAPQLISEQPAPVASRPTQRIASVRPIVEPISTAYKSEYAVERLRTLLIEAGEVPKENATAIELARQFYPETKNLDSLIRALENQAPQPTQAKVATATLIKPDAKPPVKITLPDGTVRAVQMPPLPDIKAEWKLAFDKVYGQELDRLARAEYQSQFGNEAPSHLKTFDIVKLINPENTSKYLTELIRKAEDLATEALPPEKMRGACLSDLPATEASHQARGRVLPNICSVDNDAPIQANQYITMRDVGEPIPKPEKRGLWDGVRAIFAGATTPAHEFMGEAIGRVQINDMVGAKLAIGLR